MKTKRSKQSLLLLWAAMAALLSQNLFVPVICAENFEEQKNYYTPTPTPDPHVGTPPTGPSYNPPSHGSGGGHATPTPSHGGGGHHGGNPPANCGNPPRGGGGHHHTPSPGGGGYYHSPPTTPTPTTPTPITPTPPVVTPPTTPIDPGTPSTPPTIVPTPPFPITPPFTCIFWRNHPTLIWGLLGWFGTVGNAFGVPTVPGVGVPGTGTPGVGTPGVGTPGVGANMNLLQALSNTREDGLGQLYREGTAALLNSMAYTKFPFSTSQVRERFVSGLSSNNAARAQAQLFRLANEGRALPKA